MGLLQAVGWQRKELRDATPGVPADLILSPGSSLKTPFPENISGIKVIRPATGSGIIDFLFIS